MKFTLVAVAKDQRSSSILGLLSTGNKQQVRPQANAASTAHQAVKQSNMLTRKMNA